MLTPIFIILHAPIKDHVIKRLIPRLNWFCGWVWQRLNGRWNRNRNAPAVIKCYVEVGVCAGWVDAVLVQRACSTGRVRFREPKFNL